MKTLLEWLEENRSSLRDGVYEVSGMGNLVYNGNFFAGSAYGDGDLDGEGMTYQILDGIITRVVNCKTRSKTEPKNKYNRQCKGVTIDVYDVLKAFEVIDPALQHLIKKALCAGLRGHKNKEQDLIDILDSAKRALELYRDDNRSTERPPEVPGVRGCTDNDEAEPCYSGVLRDKASRNSWV